MQSTAVVILSFNHPELTSRCIRSVIPFCKSQQIFLVHNGTEPKHSIELKKRFPELLHLEIKNNRGYSGGANFGLQTAFTKYSHVLFLTNDTELIQWPLALPRGFSSVKSFKRKTEIVDSVIGIVNINTGVLKHSKVVSAELKPYELHYVPGTAFWIDRSTFKKLKGFDESYHTYWEDVDFSIRAQKMQIPLGFSEDTVIRHGVGKTCHKNSFYTFYLFNRNRRKFMKTFKFGGPAFAVRFFFETLKRSHFNLKKLKEIYSNS